MYQLLQQKGLIIQDVFINIFALNSYDEFVGLKSKKDDEFIHFIGSFVLVKASRLSFGVKGKEDGVGLFSVELLTDC